MVRLTISAALVAALCILAFVRSPRPGRQVPAGPVTFVEVIMAAPIEVTLPGGEGRAAAEIVFDVFREVDAEMSEWKPTSPLSAVNAAAGDHPVAVPRPLLEVVQRGLAIGARTDGAFDVTWAALWGLWDFKAEKPRVPDEEEIRARIALVDFRAVRIDEASASIYLPRKGMMIGLGGIAKGYALDLSAARLRAAGVSDFLISAGGQLYAGGRNGARAWRAGIRDPRGTPADYFTALTLQDVSLSTSGDYERFFVLDGRRYHHILDPRTGRPAEGPRSVTVISPDATLADAMSTAMLVLGRARALELAAADERLEVVIVDADGGVHVSGGLRGRLRPGPELRVSSP